MPSSFIKTSLITLAITLLASCGGGDTASTSQTTPSAATTASKASIASATPRTGTNVLVTTTIPGFPHSIDIYTPAVATKIVIFLHGGGGHNYEFANDLGINTVDAPAVQANVNWPVLVQDKMIAVFPQGQAVKPITTRWTWTNHVMNSGQDDVAFLMSLVSYLKTTYPNIQRFYIAGHSNGAFMVNRMWCEQPTQFNAYFSLSGPESQFYVPNASQCKPHPQQPYYGIVGELDDVLQITGNFSNPLWFINPADVDPDYVDDVLVGGWKQHTMRAASMCGETPSLSDEVTTNDDQLWTNCGGKLMLRHDLDENHNLGMPTNGPALLQTMSDFFDDMNRLTKGGKSN